jgi:hypothetical protein
MKITLTIDDADWQTFRAGFLEAYPVPLDPDHQPITTEDNWIADALALIAHNLYETGLRQIAARTAPTKPHIFTNKEITL